MKSDEMMSDLPDGCRLGLSERLLLRYVADHLYEGELASGMGLRDLSDVHAFLYELANVTRIPAKVTAMARPSQPRWDTCPRCGHVHEGIGQCGVSMGGGGLCRCEVEVAI